EAPSVQSRSRRDGARKECSTKPETTRIGSGLMPEEKRAVGEPTEWKNQRQAAMAPAATKCFTHHGGRTRVACEKAIPPVTSTMAPIAVVQAISPREAQAAMAMAAAP